MIDAVQIDPILFVRWKEQCDAQDVPLIKRSVESASREIGADRLVYISLIPIGVPPPDARTRAALRDGTVHARERCASVHIVIEGAGLRRALIRSISAGLLLATRASFLIHADVRSALEAAAQTVAMDIDEILGHVKEQGWSSSALA